jgi:hypothetical protein
MPAVPPGATIAPGIVAPASGYPQYGVGGGTPGSSGGWNIVTANNDAQKLKYASQGYLTWFSTQADAQAFIGSESGPLSGNLSGPLAPLGEIGDFFHRLTEAETWIRFGEVGVGVILLYAGLRALSHGSSVAGVGARKSAAKPVRKVVKAGAKISVPEARVIARTGAKRVAPKTTSRVAKHRAHVAQYGAKKPYSAPVAKPPRVTTRVSHIYHHKGPVKK